MSLPSKNLTKILLSSSCRAVDIQNKHSQSALCIADNLLSITVHFDGGRGQTFLRFLLGSIASWPLHVNTCWKVILIFI